MNTKGAMLRLREAPQISPETTGLQSETRPLVQATGPVGPRPLALTWITDDLLQYTQDVWSRAYGRPVSEDEAIEVLLNVKRLAEAMI